MFRCPLGDGWSIPKYRHENAYEVEQEKCSIVIRHYSYTFAVLVLVPELQWFVCWKERSVPSNEIRNVMNAVPMAGQ